MRMTTLCPKKGSPTLLIVTRRRISYQILITVTPCVSSEAKLACYTTAFSMHNVMMFSIEIQHLFNVFNYALLSNIC